MSRDLYIDTDSRQFVEGFNNAAVKIQGSYFKGDTETLNLYFLQRTGIIGTPYVFSNQSSSTAKLTFGTPGQAALLSVTGFSVIDQSITCGVTITQMANKDSQYEWKNQIQKISFSKKPLDGFYNLVTGTTGITASFSNNAFVLNNQPISIFNLQKLLFTSITGATCDATINTVNSVYNSTGSVFNFGDTSYSYYNGKVTFNYQGNTYLKKVVIASNNSIISLYSNENSTPFPRVGDSVVFSGLVGVSGITSGSTYYVSRSNNSAKTFSITSSSAGLPTVLAIIHSDISDVTYAVTGVTANRISFRSYDATLGYISGDVEYNMDGPLPQGRFKFTSLIDLTGVTAGTYYHINTSRDTVLNGKFFIYEGEGWGQGDGDPQVTGISTSNGNVSDPGLSATSISNFTASNPVYSFNTISESTTDISYGEDIKSIQKKLEGLPTIGIGNVSLIENLDGSIQLTFIGSRAYTNLPVLSINSHLISAPGLTATVGITSAAITTLLSGTTSAPVTLEVELTTSSNKLTAAQGDAILAVALSH
jgi:hypothetical protein